MALSDLTCTFWSSRILGSVWAAMIAVLEKNPPYFISTLGGELRIMNGW